ncbi:hypothetical protein RCH14_002716 [Massilia sp. MP_M2]|uniref:hypothetical protein n=1 Tax=Massilia sp. MP_M2 TaxID=3071713 RepID=UPI00319E9FCF
MTFRLVLTRLAVPAASLMACLGMVAAGSVLAADANFCTSMCESTQRECRAQASSGGKERFAAPPETSARNSLARTAEGEVPGQGARALQAAGDTQRRLDRTGACDKAYQQCTRSCVVQPDTKQQAAPAQR